MWGWCGLDRDACNSIAACVVLQAPTTLLSHPSSPSPPFLAACSFYSAVSASGLSEAVQSLSSGGTPPRWVVIDDGWQCTEVDEPYRNIPTEQLKQQTAKLMKKTPAEGGSQVGGRAVLVHGGVASDRGCLPGLAGLAGSRCHRQWR